MIWNFCLTREPAITLLISSPEPLGSQLAYSIAMVRRPSTFSKIFSETAQPIKLKCNVVPPLIGVRKLIHRILVK